MRRDVLELRQFYASDLGRAALVIPGPMNKFTDFLGTHLLPRSMMTAVFGRMLSRARVPRPRESASR